MDIPFIKIKEAGKETETLFVRHRIMASAGISENTMWNAKLRQSNSWHIIDNPKDKRENLYGFDALSDVNKDKVKLWLKNLTQGACDCPYIYTALQPIREAIVRDDKAEAFYLSYTYELNGKPNALKPEAVAEYTRNASLLNMLLTFQQMKSKELKARFGMSWMDFVEQVFKVIKADGYNLPASYRNLIMDILKNYQQNSYKALISARTGNQNRTKVKDLGKDMMLELLSHSNQYDDAYIALAYNKWAKDQGYEPVSRATIKNKRVDYGYLINADRMGWQEWNKTFNTSVKRLPPSAPTYLWEGDDNHIDWWFVDDKNNIKRLKAYVIVDSYKGICYPLGWAFSENDITKDTIYLAFLMAIQHVKEQTGEYCLPRQIMTDRWGGPSLVPYYEGLATHYVPPALGSKNRGWLENYFGHPDWKRSLKMGPDGYPANNYTGHNISSKEMGVNTEALQLAHRQKQLPNIEQAGEYMAAHFERLRTIPIGWDEKNKTRQQEWLEGWAAMPESDKRIVTQEQVLLKAGFRHSINGGNTITKEGVQITIRTKEFSYKVPPAIAMQNTGAKVETIYSPFDMSRVLMTDNKNLRFMADSTVYGAGCLADMNDGGRTLLNELFKEKEANVEMVTSSKMDRRNRLAAAGQDAEVTLKLGGMARKELKTAAIEQFEKPYEIEAPVSKKPQNELEHDWELEAENSL